MMKLLKAKKYAIKNSYDEELVQALVHSHKFSIDVVEVFGRGFQIDGPQEWLKNLQHELFPFLNLPHEEMYIEYPNSFPGIGNFAYGLLAHEEEDVILVNPVIIENNIAGFSPMQFMLGAKRELNEVDFPSRTHYRTWKTHSSNKSNRFAALDLSGGQLSEAHTTMCTSSMALFMESLMYINAKGVGTTTNYPKIKKHVKRKSPIKEWSYKTLRIIKKGEPTNIHHRGREKVPFISRSRREHSVRGHIRLHPTAGPVWVSPHIRCRGTEGKVLKDYEIK